MGAFLGRLEPFLVWLVQTSLQASVLLCLVLLVQWAFRRKLPARWRYGLWVLVLVRMALPIAPQSDLSVFNFINVDLRNTYPSHPADSSAGMAETASLENGQAAGITDQSLRAGGTSTLKPTQAAVNGPPIGLSDSLASQAFTACCHTAWTVFAYIWPVGAMLLIARLAVATVGLRRRTSALPACTDGQVLEMLEAAKVQMGVTMHIPVLVSSSLQSPALAGVLRPKLLLPSGITETLTAEELRYVFLHELAHLKRLDLPVNLLMIVLVILHWFNPLLWYALRRMRADRELACDALMLSRARPEEHKGYGLTLIKLLQTAVCPPALTPGMVGILENSEHIKTRIRMIARFHANADRRSALGAGLLMMLGVVSLTNASTRPAEFLQPASLATLPLNEPAPAPLPEPAAKVQPDANPPAQPNQPASRWGETSPWAGLSGNFGLPITDVNPLAFGMSGRLASSVSDEQPVQGFGRRFYSEDATGLTFTGPRTTVVSVPTGGGWGMNPANDARPGAVSRPGIGQNVLDLIAQPGSVDRSFASNPSPSLWESASGSTDRATISRAPIVSPLQNLIQQLDDESTSESTSHSESTSGPDRPVNPATVWQQAIPPFLVIPSFQFHGHSGNGSSVQSVNTTSSLALFNGCNAVDVGTGTLVVIDMRLVGTIDPGLVNLTISNAVQATLGEGGSTDLFRHFQWNGNSLIPSPARPGTYGPPPLNGGSYSSVPEPATLVLLVIGGLATLRRRRRHNCELQIANCELQIANCELRIADCELRIANCGL